ncbi:MAG TPA: amidohydrolase family protein [Bacteroidota bacterium]|nr:amidohydrolase family protein [Bacteroidota bacterium]
MLDGTSSRPLHHVNVVYNADSILFVGSSLPPRSVLHQDQSQPDSDLPGYTLLPGLIEAHAHLYLEGGDLDLPSRKRKQAPEELLAAAHRRLKKILRWGIIGVRDAGDKIGVGISLRRMYAKRTEPLPYIDSPGAAINHKGEYGSFMAEPVEEHTSPRECVVSRIDAGADRIKLIATDIIDFKSGKVLRDPQMTLDEIAAFVRAAKEFGKQTFAHASGESGIQRVIEGNVDSVEHGYFVNDDQLAQLRDRNIAWVPTIVPVQRQIDLADRMGWDGATVSQLKRILDRHYASLRKAEKLGVIIVAGSDAGAIGVQHGYGLLEELVSMEQAGISPFSIIGAATGNGGQRLGFKEKFGVIKVGYRSRFIVTQHSPLDGIANLLEHKQIVYDGAVYEGDKNTDREGL